MNSLPHGIAGPLHIEEPFPVWALVLAGLLLWLAYRAFRRLRQRLAPSPPTAFEPPPIRPGPSRITGVIETIRHRYLERREYRRGCHELGAVLRQHFQENVETRSSLTALTAAEMTRRIGDTPVARFFGLLAQLQFYRRPPTRSDFDGACDVALDVVGSHAPIARVDRD